LTISPISVISSLSRTANKPVCAPRRGLLRSTRSAVPSVSLCHPFTRSYRPEPPLLSDHTSWCLKSYPQLKALESLVSFFKTPEVVLDADSWTSETAFALRFSRKNQAGGSERPAARSVVGSLWAPPSQAESAGSGLAARMKLTAVKQEPASGIKRHRPENGTLT
jgi:hypothetical protein